MIRPAWPYITHQEWQYHSTNFDPIYIGGAKPREYQL